MKLEDFKEALYGAGWLDTHDAQHSGIENLHAVIWPAVAALEAEVQELKFEVLEAMGRGQCYGD